jgi:hypothetical protein
MSRRSRMFAVLVCVGVASSAWAAEPTGTAVGPFRSSAVKTEKAVGPLRGSAVHTDKTVGHDAKSAAQSPVLDLNAGF